MQNLLKYTTSMRTPFISTFSRPSSASFSRCHHQCKFTEPLNAACAKQHTKGTSSNIFLNHWTNLEHCKFTCLKNVPSPKAIPIRALSTSCRQSSPSESSQKSEMKENIFTIPNLLTLSRIVLTPVLGYCVLHEWYILACSIFIYAGTTDLLDGWIARRYTSQMSSFGSFLDPLADKLLVSTLFITLSMMQLIPMPLTGIVIARDVGLVAAAFYVRYISLPPPKTLQRYFNATHVTSNLKPLFISKLNTALQLALVAFTLPAPVFSYVDHVALQALWYVTATTTISSGVAYMFAKDTFKIISNTKQKKD